MNSSHGFVPRFFGVTQDKVPPVGTYETPTTFNGGFVESVAHTAGQTSSFACTTRRFGNAASRRDRHADSDGNKLEAMARSPSSGHPMYYADQQFDALRPDAVGGQVPVGWLVLAPGAAAPDLLRRWRASARDAVGGHAEPGAVIAVSALPKTVTGKTQRGLLQASLEGKAALCPARARTVMPTQPVARSTIRTPPSSQAVAIFSPGGT